MQADIERAFDLLDQDRPEVALARLEPYLERFGYDTDLRYALGAAYNQLGDVLQALEHLLAADPRGRYAHVALEQARAYAALELDVHVLRALQRYIKGSDPDDPHLDGARAALAELKAQGADLAEQAGTTPDRLERAHYAMERGRLAILLGEFGAAVSPLQAALRMAPGLTPAHNNLALAYFQLDRVDEAIAIEEKVLQDLEPDDVFALAHLMWLWLVTGQPERAEALWPRLDALLPSASEPGHSKAVEALALLGKHQQVYDLLRAVGVDELSPMELAMLGAAAGNLGHLQEAQTYLEAARELEPLWPVALANLGAVEQGEAGWGPEGQLPYISPFGRIPSAVVERFEGLMDGVVEDAQGFEAVKALCERWPALVDVVGYSQWHPAEAELVDDVQDVLRELGTPRAVEHLRAYAFGTWGEPEQRHHALAALGALGEVESGELVEMWDGEAWRQVQSLGYKIGYEDEDWPYDPETVKRLEAAMEAHQAGELEQAKALYHVVLEREPDAKEALQNLGALWSGEGRPDKAEPLYRRALEIEPKYVFALCNLAQMHMMRGEVDEALALVHQAMQNRKLTPEAFRSLQSTHARILVEQGEYEYAARAVEIYVDVFPKDAEMQEWLGRLQSADAVDGWTDWWQARIDRYAERQLRKPIEGTDLAALMSRLPKTAYQGMYRTLGISGISALRKAEMGEAIAGWLRTPSFLARTVRRLDEGDRAALGYALDAGGVVPYEDAVARFGDEADDSPYWEAQRIRSSLGRLRVRGLLFAGELEGETVLVVPEELLPALREILGSRSGGAGTS
jgi:tetratricopeptide (TPR) repeat protein